MTKHGHGDDTITYMQLAKRLGIEHEIVYYDPVFQSLATWTGRTWRITEAAAADYDPILTAREAATILGHASGHDGTRNVTRWLASGRIKGFRDNDQWRVRLSELRTFMETRGQRKARTAKK